MALSTYLPGFANPVSDAQQTFRAVLTAMAQPGQIQAIDVKLQPPTGFSPAMAAVCLTLLDLDVSLWLPPELPSDCRDWLVFHTGCQLTTQIAQADFAVVCESPLDLQAFNPGTPEYPEASTTVFYQLPDLTQGEPVTLQGPGIQQEIAIAPPVATDFWSQWQDNHHRYPLGVDVLLVAEAQVLGLPRSMRSGR